MTYNDRAPAGARNQRRLRFWSWRAATLASLLVFVVGGCSSLLEVDLPGSVQATDLLDPALAETLALSVQGDFECGLVDHIDWPGLWFDLFLNSSTSRPNALMELRAQLVDVYADPCASGTGPTWTVLQLPRIQGENIRTILDGYADGECLAKFQPACSLSEDVDANWIRARSFFYEAYSLQILTEAFCAMTVNGGPLMTRGEAFAEAETRFNSALSFAALVTTDETDFSPAELTTAALIGRARSQLYQGNTGSIAADLAAIPMDFEFMATYDNSPSRRRNGINTDNNRGSARMPHRQWTNLTLSLAGELTQNRLVAGTTDIDDPRVEIDYDPGRDFGGRGFITFRTQEKYDSRAAGIPFATGREALLMIAEVDPSQTVAIINTLRSDATGVYSGLDTSAWPLPAYAGGTAADIATTLREERKRELWMQSQNHGDVLRWEGMPRPAGMQTTSQKLAGTPAIQEFEPISEYGSPRGTFNCQSIPFLERTSNEFLTDGDQGRAEYDAGNT